MKSLRIQALKPSGELGTLDGRSNDCEVASMNGFPSKNLLIKEASQEQRDEWTLYLGGDAYEELDEAVFCILTS